MNLFLYVEDFGPSNPVILSGPRGIQFIWDPQLGKHVHRFKDLADFQKRARDIILEETVWKVLPGIQLEEGAVESSDADGKADELRLVLAACLAVAEGDVALKVEELADFIHHDTTFKAVQNLRNSADADRNLIDELTGGFRIDVVSDEALADEVRRREKAKVLRILLVDDENLPADLVAEYARIIGEKTGVPVAAGDVALQIITAEMEFGLGHGIGFNLMIGDRRARQAIILNHHFSEDGLKEQALAALGEYFRKPDIRLVVDDELLQGNTLPLQGVLNEDRSVTVSIAPLPFELEHPNPAKDETTSKPETSIEVDPQGGNPPPDSPPGEKTPDPLPAVDPADPPSEVASADIATTDDAKPSADSEMTVTEAAKTLGNGVKEPADTEAAKVLATAAAASKKKKNR